MADAIVITLYRSPLTCAARVRLLRKLNPACKIYLVYTGDSAKARSFEDVFRLADSYYCVPTTNTKDNWYGLDQALAQWWIHHGSKASITRLLFLDWDVLLLDPATILLDQLSHGTILFTHVFPVTNISQDHWAREFLSSFGADSRVLSSSDQLYRAYLFCWGCFATDFSAVAESILHLRGFCEIRLPYAFRLVGAQLQPFTGISSSFCNVLGRRLSRERLRLLSDDAGFIKLAHPVYLPVCSPLLDVDRTAWLLEAPYLKTFLRRVKQACRSLLVLLRLVPPVNP